MGQTKNSSYTKKLQIAFFGEFQEKGKIWYEFVTRIQILGRKFSNHENIHRYEFTLTLDIIALRINVSFSTFLPKNHIFVKDFHQIFAFSRNLPKIQLVIYW